MRIVLAESLEGAIAEELWRMYEPSMTELAALAASSTAYGHDDFLAMLAEPRIMKYLAQDDDGTTVGLLAITRHLELAYWISPEYFAARWPKEYADGHIYYVATMAMHPDHRGLGGFKQLLEPIAHIASRENGVVAFDSCAYNKGTIDMFMRVLRYGVEFTGRQPEGHELDHLTFYAVTFDADADTGDEKAAFDDRVINLDAEVAGSGRPNR